jgi:cytoskeletal protein CcmA (bactofilin family)
MENSKDCLMIGEGVSIAGTISLAGAIYVYGNVNGEIVAREIYVGPGGKVTGEVKVELADIRGEVANSIQAKETLIVRSTGKVSGIISYQSIEIENGGMVDGTIEKVSTGKVLNMPVTALSESR